MKRTSVLLVCLILASVFSTEIVSAQSRVFGENVKFGLKGGFNVTSSNDEDRVADSKVTPRPGFHVGGLAHIHLTDTWALQPEIMYSKEGARYDFPGYTGKTDLNLVNLPILVQYMIGPGFRIQTGPQVGLVTSAKFEDTNNKEFEKNDIQKGNFSWTFGFGYLLKSGFGFDARGSLGLSNMYKKDFYPGQSARTRSGQFGFFYQFK